MKRNHSFVDLKYPLAKDHLKFCNGDRWCIAHHLTAAYCEKFFFVEF